MVVEVTSYEELKTSANVSGESSVTGAKFDDWKACALSLPGVLNPLRNFLREGGGELGGGGKVTSDAENRTRAGVVSTGTVEGGRHEVIEAGEAGVS